MDLKILASTAIRSGIDIMQYLENAKKGCGINCQKFKFLISLTFRNLGRSDESKKRVSVIFVLKNCWHLEFLYPSGSLRKSRCEEFLFCCFLFQRRFLWEICLLTNFLGLSCKLEVSFKSKANKQISHFWIEWTDKKVFYLIIHIYKNFLSKCIRVVFDQLICWLNFLSF